MARREQFVNNSRTTLASSMTDVATTATVVDGSVFPADGDFRIIISGELMLVTARSTNVLTVVRGIENSIAAAHNSSETVTALLTKASLEQYQKENTWHGNTSPALRIHKLSNGDFGVVSDFTFVNQGSATATDRDGRIVMQIPFDVGQQVRGIFQTAPTPPYEIILAVKGVGPREDFFEYGLAFRESSTSKLFTISRQFQDTLEVSRYTNNTTLAGNDFTDVFGFGGGLTWMKIEDDNTDLKFFVGPNGQDWIELHSAIRTTHMAGGPNQVGIYGNPNTANTIVGLIETFHFGEV